MEFDYLTILNGGKYIICMYMRVKGLRIEFTLWITGCLEAMTDTHQEFGDEAAV